MHPLTEVWWKRFVNRTDGTLRQSGNGWHFEAQELTRPEVDAALRAHQSLGVYAADQNGFSRWLCLDADDAQGKDALQQLAIELNPTCTMFEPSRRGAHLWWCCPPTQWERVRQVGHSLARQAGVACEVFPKGKGRNGVRLPPKTGETYPIVDPLSGEIRSVEDLASLCVEPLPQIVVPQVVAADRHVLGESRGSFAELWREVEQLTKLRQYGPERAIGHCPFHDDQHPSLSILGGFWRCWAGCGEGGINAFRARARGLERR
jgi:hypothetical protein